VDGEGLEAMSDEIPSLAAVQLPREWFLLSTPSVADVAAPSRYPPSSIENPPVLRNQPTPSRRF
jgi:hypothetical protein